MELKKIIYAICGLTIIFGLWGLFDRIVNGHQDAAYGSYVVWGLWVAMYLFFAGTSAGAFMVSTLDLLFNVRIFKGTGPTALWVALVSLASGLLLIWLDLGHPERIWKVYLQGQAGSVMTQMVWGYTVLGLLLVASLYLAIRKPHSRELRILMIIGLPLSLFVSGAVGALLGVQASRLFWHVGLFPVQFPFASLASGVAAVTIALGLFGKRNDPDLPEQMKVLSIATIVLLFVKMYFFWADFSLSLYGNVPQNVMAVNELLFGSYWWGFWILQIVLGTLIPFAILVRPRFSRSPEWAGWMSVLVLVGLAVARANIVFPALTVPEIAAMTTAFSGPHLSFEYFPSLMEWAVTLGASGLAVLAFLVGCERLPLRTGEE